MKSAILLCCLFLQVTSTCGSLVEQFNTTSHQLMRYITSGPGKGVAYEWLAELADGFGSRQVGSESLEKAIDFVVEKLKKDGFDNVHTEEIPNLPHWRRGDDVVMMLEPRAHKLNILAIDGTPPGDITAEAVVITDFDELKNVNISGKIVVIVEQWTGYGETAKYRRAANNKLLHGAVGVLVKSVTPFSIGSPHTGSGSRGSALPSACITLEEAEMLKRIYQRKKRILIRMNIKSREVGKVSSRNTIFDVTGTTHPNEIVLLSGHMDSWDVGQGALDDGGGMAVAWHALKVLKDLGKRDHRFAPKRTLRVVFWTAEEQGLFGAQAYFNASKGRSEKMFFVSESDQGAFRPTNWDSVLNAQGNKTHLKKLDETVKLINQFGIPLSIKESSSQGDVASWAAEGVPSVNYVSDKGTNYYFFFHHTQADYMNIFQEGDLEYTTAIFATLAHVIGNMDNWE